MKTYQKFAVLGAGAWGIALTTALTRAGRSVVLITKDEATAERLQKERTNSQRLPTIPLSQAVEITHKREAIENSDAVVLVVPAQRLASEIISWPQNLCPNKPLILCSKGIEQASDRFLSRIIKDALPLSELAILSGPSFASDVARGLPTAVTLAAEKLQTAQNLSTAMGSQSFRLYYSDDITGVEIGGAAKNVLALAAGIVEGRGLGASAKAALIARGFAELVRFGLRAGARLETLTGLSGLGDLVLSASSSQSRNHALGVLIGQSGKMPKDQDPSLPLAEGRFTAPALVRLSEAMGVEMPICQAVAHVLGGQLSVDAAIEALMSREQKMEGIQWPLG